MTVKTERTTTFGENIVRTREAEATEALFVNRHTGATYWMPIEWAETLILIEENRVEDGGEGWLVLDGVFEVPAYRVEVVPSHGSWTPLATASLIVALVTIIGLLIHYL